MIKSFCKKDEIFYLKISIQFLYFHLQQINNAFYQMINEQDKQISRKRAIGNFTIGKSIGKGTFASVREGIHTPTNQKVAIKILHKKMIVDNRDKINLSREIRIFKKLRHPNIAQLFQFIETNSKIYFIMENVSGGELYELIVNSKQNRLSEQKASKYFQQLLNAVEYLHSLGITHRDLKPQNIMIGENDMIKLIDFGLSNLYQQNQQLSTACGSPCYAAPEMLTQKLYSPLKVDIWSCGIVLYTMLVGYLPFQHQKTFELCKLIQQGVYDEPGYLSQYSKDILKKMMQVDPNRRLTINELRKHPFCQAYQQPILKGLLPGQKIYMNTDLIQQMKSLGYNGFIKDVEQDQRNENNTAFYLLLIKKIKENNLDISTYYSQRIQKQFIIRSKSLVAKREVNEQLPAISKDNLKSMLNLQKLKEASILCRIYASEHKMGKIVRPANMRIKRIQYK